jgi:hypothetical protein
MPSSIKWHFAPLSPPMQQGAGHWVAAAQIEHKRRAYAIGDSGLGPWLRNSVMGRITENPNPQLKCDPPMQLLPPVATDVRLEYFMMNAFYVIEFTVAASPPVPDYHMMIPSARGGSHWTRFYGNLEGVSDEAKKLAHEARKKTGKSMHDWLDEVVRQAAQNELAN